MALDPDALEKLITAALESEGFAVDNKHAKTANMAKAIAIAVVTHITASSTVITPLGTYKVT